MKSSTKLLLCALLALAAGRARGQDDQAITGYVSRAVSTSDFDVNGLRVLCTGKTRGVPKPAQKPAKGAKVAIVPCPGDAPWVGEGMAVHYTGVVDDNRIVATWIDRHSAPRLGEVSGSAVIDAPPAHEAAGLTVRADGYRIHIAGETKSDFTAPLKSLADVNAGDWIKYKGKLTPAGLVEAASVEIGPNTIGDSEEKLREKSEFDAGAAPTITKRDHLKNALTLSYDPRQFPRFKDDVMQARVEEIGDSLVPAYQRALPNSDPAKINFRFQVVDNKHFCNLLACETYAMPSGIIQVPHRLWREFRTTRSSLRSSQTASPRYWRGKSTATREKSEPHTFRLPLRLSCPMSISARAPVTRRLRRCNYESNSSATGSAFG